MQHFEICFGGRERIVYFVKQYYSYNCSADMCIVSFMASSSDCCNAKWLYYWCCPQMPRLIRIPSKHCWGTIITKSYPIS